MLTRPQCVMIFAAAISACAEPSSPSHAVAFDFEPSSAKAVADPTAIVQLPLADSGLSVKSDRNFSDGTFSAYAHGVCGITATIFLSGSGDMVMDGGKPNAPDRKCVFYPRKVTVVYPDGAAETISGPLLSVSQLESATYLIPIGSTAKRHFHVRTSTTRCDGVHWGGLVGGDSVFVTRASASSWHVYTQPSPNNNAACKRSTGNTLLGPMTIDLWITSSRDLP